jgi:hypothetical protein
MAGDANSFIELAHEGDFDVGALSVCPSLRSVSIRGASQQLEPRVMQVLVALARSAGGVVSRDDLVKRCWGGRVVGEDAINRAVSRVRKLGEETAAFSIETIARVSRAAPGRIAALELARSRRCVTRGLTGGWHIKCLHRGPRRPHAWRGRSADR